MKEGGEGGERDLAGKATRRRAKKKNKISERVEGFSLAGDGPIEVRQCWL